MGFDLTSLLNLYRDYLAYQGRKNIRADITLLLEGGGGVTFPVPPDKLPTITSPQNNDTFNSVIGDVSIMGLLGLRTVEFEDFLLPSDTSNYSWARGDNGSDIINFINDNRQKGQPFRIIITKGDVTYLNMNVLVDDFDYYMDNQADYHMNASFTEYRTYNSQTGGLET
nr:MAG TPA: tail assembly protein [Caudoviricetes sp.]